MPYRAIIPVGQHQNNGTILYQVAGSVNAPCGGEKAMRLAVDIHGGECFYCKKALVKKDKTYQWTLDHIEPTAIGGKNNLTNFVVACAPCNSAKANKVIEAFNPIASEEWLVGLRDQINGRLKRLRERVKPTKSQSTTPPSSPHPPSQGAASDP